MYWLISNRNRNTQRSTESRMGRRSTSTNWNFFYVDSNKWMWQKSFLSLQLVSKTYLASNYFIKIPLEYPSVSFTSSPRRVMRNLMELYLRIWQEFYEKRAEEKEKADINIKSLISLKTTSWRRTTQKKVLGDELSRGFAGGNFETTIYWLQRKSKIHKKTFLSRN